MSTASIGFVFERPLVLQHWKPLAVGADIPLAAETLCPCDGATLMIFAAHRSMQDGRIMRIGSCPACGYLGRIDRPTPEWMTRFYGSGMWDSEQVRGGQAPQSVLTGNATTRLLMRMPFIKERAVCDIGCGYGEALAHLASVCGFENLWGTEASPHRAHAARERGASVLEGDLEDAAVYDAVRAAHPQAFLLNHVLEHLSVPADIVERMSAAQSVGDHIIVAVPNLPGEACMEVLSFLPHLHFFNHTSLETLFGRFGYLAVLVEESGKEIAIAFRKTNKIVPPSRHTHAPNLLFQKFVCGLGLQEGRKGGMHHLWWFRKADVGGQTFLFRNRSIDATYWRVFCLLARYFYRARVARAMGTFRGQKGLQSIAVSALPQERPAPVAPLEIFYRGPITLFYK